MRHIAILLIISFSLTSFEIDKWELKESVDGIDVYTKIDDQNKHWSRLECVMNATPDEVVKFASKIEYLNSWVYGCASSQVLSENNNITIYHIVTDMPFPISDRDIIIKKERFFDHQTGIYSSILSKDSEFDYPTEYLNVEDFQANWKYIPLENGKTKVIYEVYADPGGSIPNWLVEKFSSKGPYKSLENLRSRWD